MANTKLESILKGTATQADKKHLSRWVSEAPRYANATDYMQKTFGDWKNRTTTNADLNELEKDGNLIDLTPVAGATEIDVLIELAQQCDYDGWDYPIEKYVNNISELVDEYIYLMGGNVIYITDTETYYLENL